MVLLLTNTYCNAASTGDVAMCRMGKGSLNTGSVFLSINTCHLLLKNSDLHTYTHIHTVSQPG